ncbi:MAG: MFS transporter [Candidatus Latescibacteria bacterium]|nr:MFS transporter [Candidatus Latescibacterota bacterium]
MPFDRRAVVSWCFYDFANSAFNTLIVTFIYATFFTQVIAPDEVTGTALWSKGVSLSAIAVALLSPFLGGLADRGGHRKLYLGLFTVIAVIGTAFLYTALPGQVTKALLWFIVGNIAFELASVFYNAFLPEIAPADKIGRISGYGWALGYVGGLGAMALAMVGFVDTEIPWFGFGKENGEHIRATNLLVACWFALFSLPIFLWVKEKPGAGRPSPAPLAASLLQFVSTFRQLRRFPEISRLLIARLIYNDGLITIFAFGGIYAAGTFDFSFEEIMVFGLALNVSAGLGAFAMGFVDDWLGGKRTIQISLVGFIAASLLAVFTHDRTLFWAAGLFIGLFSGPNQAASRSLLGRFVPPDKENEFYGLFAFSGKATAFLGPLLLGELTRIFASQRAGVAVVVVFFVVGLILVRRVDEEAGIARVRQQGD